MKTISVIVPCYNESGNVAQMCNSLKVIFETKLQEYAYEIIFLDNCSTDGTREILKELCSKEDNVRAILYTRNFGMINSPVYGLLQAGGDCAVLLACDFEEPVETIPDFVREWEAGADVVAGVRSGSKQNRLMYTIRTTYYKMLDKGAPFETIDHFTGFGLYDRKFIERLRQINDPMPFIRVMVAEFGTNVRTVYYKQEERRTGKSHSNLAEYYDIAMMSFTSYTGLGLRLVTFIGFFISFISFGIGLFYLIMKLVNWNSFNAGMAPVLIGLFFLGAIVLVALGLIGEYIMSINHRLINRPLVIEEERIGFDEKEKS